MSDDYFRVRLDRFLTFKDLKDIVSSLESDDCADESQLFFANGVGISSVNGCFHCKESGEVHFAGSAPSWLDVKLSFEKETKS